jgi:3',5'-cyclic AMP phosphodiesterase CpdA
MLRLLHVSDLHFGPPYLPHLGDALLRAATTLAPDIIVASGDFTQRAKRRQFAAAREFLDRLPAIPLIVTPGNHDVPLYRIFERIFSPYSLYREYISQDLDSVLYRDDAVIVALNSTRPRGAVTNGRISKRQLDFARDAMRTAPVGAARIVVTHHNLAPAPDFDGGVVMRRARRTLEHFTDFGVDLVLSGHLHRAYLSYSLDLLDRPAPGHGVRIVQAGTATSSRGRARERKMNSFNFIALSSEMIRVTPHLYFDDLVDFAPVAEHLFPRMEARYLAGPVHGDNAGTFMDDGHDAETVADDRDTTGPRPLTERGS